MKSFVFDNFFVEEAFKEAQKAGKEGEVPVGCIIVDRASKCIRARGRNLVEQCSNPVLHAEIVAITEACKVLGSKSLAGCDMYVTLEPCSMCAGAIAHSRVDRVFYGASDEKQGAIENGVRFFTSSACFHRPEIYPAIGAAKSEALIKDFFRKIRAGNLI